MKAVSGWRALPRGVRSFVGVVCYLLSYLLLDAVAQNFTVGAGISVWYLPAALALALLFVFGLQNLPVVFAAVVLAQSVNDTSQALVSTLVHALTYSLAYGGAALLLRRLGVDPQLRRLRDVGWLMFLGAAAAPLVASLTSVTNFAVSGSLGWSEWPLLVLQYAAGDATGVGALAPFILVLLRYTSVPNSGLSTPNSDVHERTTLRRRPNLKEAGRISLFAGLIALAAFLAYVVPQDLTLNHSYITFIPVLLVAGWYGFTWAAAATLFVNICIALFASSNFGNVEAVALQFGLLTLTHLGILLGAFASERSWGAARLNHLAFHDTLTGLPNRAFFLGRLERAVNRGEHVAVLFIDLDRFRGVNDNLGHAAGDAVLVEAARRLKRCLRPDDTVARFGGDEFTALLAVDAPSDAMRVTERIQKAFASPFSLQVVQVETSIGIALGTPGSDRPDDLLRNADSALRRAKAQGRGNNAVFDPAMHTLELEQGRLERDLERAVERHELRVYYQPIVSLETHRVVGVEALLRWQHLERGLVLPNAFIPVAEQTGLIVPLGSWVIEQAFAQLGAWHKAGHTDLFMSVNISARQMQHPQLVSVVQGTLEELGLAPEHVNLELTESVFIEGIGANTAFKTLYDAGVRLSIDDFGTGYSSLSYLKRLPVHTLKIDRSFLAGIPGEESDAALVKTVLAMAHNLHLGVIAEGVETAAQADFLRAHGCEQAQGYLFSRPVPAEILEGLLGGFCRRYQAHKA